MRTRHFIAFLVVFSILMVLPGCEAVRSIMLEGGVADRLLADQVITADQHAALTGNGWGPILSGLINMAGTLLLGIPIIQKIRGPSATAEQRVERRLARTMAKAAS